jgi:hypothetical protein
MGLNRGRHVNLNDVTNDQKQETESDDNRQVGWEQVETFLSISSAFLLVLLVPRAFFLIYTI